ncbi:MAG TPA: 16S rRNA (adenine(1518)-N(6)/adenine(1519)-N(6))-dimethyltransferase RsmA [Acidimicrobiia bacterium]|nr:16S rRNA (adenine(1518)-N(6)/adenine(1519)-N(6))-dimethyltransferase RsmA [Acidimicrobiia bacterium]
MLTPTAVRALLDEHGLRPSRALGQNFLADPNTARRIVRLAEVGPDDRVLEIGPGVGSLTLALLEAGAHVVALEVDRHLVPLLEAVLADAGGAGGAGSVRVVTGDALTVDLDALLDAGPASAEPRERPDGMGQTWHCVSNLPYNVATPVVVRVLEECPRVMHLLLMVQREVGERLAAEPGSDAYGAVSVKVAYYTTARVVGTVPATVFVPTPNVESALVRLERRSSPPVDVPSTDALFTIVRAGFAQRRKMLRSALRPLLGPRTESVLTAAGVRHDARAETLGLDEWAALAREAA